MRANAAVAQRGYGASRVAAAAGSTGFLIRCLVLAGVALGAFQGWSSFKTEPAPPAQQAVPAETITGIQITLGQAALALRDFGKSGLLSDRFDFESGMSRVRRSVEALEGMTTEPQEEQALGRTRTLLDRLAQIAKEHIQRTDAGGGPMRMETLQEIPRLRDEAAVALADYRQVKAGRVITAETDSVSRMLRGAIGGAAALLSVCIGAITLWSRLFPA